MNTETSQIDFDQLEAAIEIPSDELKPNSEESIIPKCHLKLIEEQNKMEDVKLERPPMSLNKIVVEVGEVLT
jgi:hypothetical protein